MPTTIQLRRGTASQWSSVNPTLHSGEPAFESDTGKLKIGRDDLPWNDLEYVSGGLIAGSGDTLYVGTAPGGPHLASSNDGTVHELTLTGDTVINLDGPGPGVHYLTMIIKQDAVGGHSLSWSTSVAWSGGSVPVIPSFPDSVSIFTLMTVNDGVVWYGFVSGEDMFNAGIAG